MERKHLILKRRIGECEREVSVMPVEALMVVIMIDIFWWLRR